MNDRNPDDLSGVVAYYTHEENEAARLSMGIGPLEWHRTTELLCRYLPEPPAVIYDIGGGPGHYSHWLARMGYEVHLVDLTPAHVERVRCHDRAHPDERVASASVGDARDLDAPDGCADLVLLHGPLYHLVRCSERMLALREAARIARPGGRVVGIGITRFASTHVGLVRGWLSDPDYLSMMLGELDDGHHVRPASWPGIFCDAYFHRPEELGEEMVAAGLEHEETLAIEGAGWLVPEFGSRWLEVDCRRAILEVVRRLEREPVGLGMSPHLMAVASVP